MNLTKKILFVLISLVLTHCTNDKPTAGKTVIAKEKLVSTITIKADRKSFSKFISDPCDTFSIEFDGLYPIIDTLPNAFSDTLLTDNYLRKLGFRVISSSHGNWDEGPRFMELDLIKDDCKCTVFKKYYYHDSLPDGAYNLRITEKLVCNADNNAVE